jgi:hypothetical protein
MSWDLSNTNISLQDKDNKHDKLETIREEREHQKSIIDNNDSNTKPRFEGNKYQDQDNESIAEEDQEDLTNVIKSEQINNKIDLDVVQES